MSDDLRLAGLMVAMWLCGGLAVASIWGAFEWERRKAARETEAEFADLLARVRAWMASWAGPKQPRVWSPPLWLRLVAAWGEVRQACGYPKPPKLQQARPRLDWPLMDAASRPTWPVNSAQSEEDPAEWLRQLKERSQRVQQRSEAYARDGADTGLMPRVDEQVKL